MIAAVVHNAGTRVCDGSRCASPSTACRSATDQTIGQIAPGGTGRATVVWDTQGQNGTHTITATADPANAIVEKDESNNAASRPASVQGSKVVLQ